MTREISPLDAIARNARSGSPGFGENRNSAVSFPCAEGAFRFSSAMEKSDLTNPRTFSPARTFSASFRDALSRSTLSCSPWARISSSAAEISASRVPRRSDRLRSSLKLAGRLFAESNDIFNCAPVFPLQRLDRVKASLDSGEINRFVFERGGVGLDNAREFVCGDEDCFAGLGNPVRRKSPGGSVRASGAKDFRAWT